MWGNTKFTKTWRTTGNALEQVAENHNDSLLILDELSQIASKEAGQIVYMLGNGQGKSRMRRDTSMRRTKEWRLVILSSGEISISDKIAEEGGKAKAGQLVRCVDCVLENKECPSCPSCPTKKTSRPEFTFLLFQDTSRLQMNTINDKS
jgi:putative DNA primase/helicase